MLVLTIVEIGAKNVLVANSSVGLNKDGFLLIGPGLPFYVRAQLVVPSFPALLSYPARKVPCNRAPLSLPL